MDVIIDRSNILSFDRNLGFMNKVEMKQKETFQK